MLVQRIFFGALLIVGVAAVIWGDMHIASRSVELSHSLNLNCGSIIPLAVMLLAMAGAYESVNLVRAAGYEPMAWAIFGGVLLLNGLAWAVPAVFADSDRSVFECQLIVLVLAALTIGFTQISRRRTDRGIGDIAVSIMILVYMGILPSFITSIRTQLPGQTGILAVCMFITIVKITDIGAYFTGIAIGKTKLIPAISPGKTVEGLAGGFLLAIITSLVLTYYLPWPEQLGSVPISLLQAVFFGILIAGVGSLGDLVESVLKRDATSKDSGKVIPAFGGILDLLDSPAFAAPVGYLLLISWLA